MGLAGGPGKTPQQLSFARSTAEELRLIGEDQRIGHLVVQMTIA